MSSGKEPGGRGRRAFGLTAWRCVRLRCPACGGASIVERPFQIRHHCPACRALFKREEGFFVGAIVSNVLTTELAVLLAYLLFLPLASTRFDLLLGILFAVAILFPVAYYHHSWSVWLSADYLVESLPKYDEHGRARLSRGGARRNVSPRNGSGGSGTNH